MSDEQVLVNRCDRAGLLCLNRPEALNALTSDMFERLSGALTEWREAAEIYAVVLESSSPRAFCAGGDVRRVAETVREDPGAAAAFLHREYNYNWQLDNFAKPHVSLMNGMVLGGGAGVSIYGTHRVAGENFSFGMPETIIGFVPDVGGSWFLGHMPGSVGLYLGLTGRSIKRADAYDLGLVTHIIDSHRFDEIKQALCDAEPVDPLLDDMDQPPERDELELKNLRSWIEAVFSASTLPEIFERAEKLEDETDGWSRQVLEELQARSPSSLYLTMQLWKRGRELNLSGALQQEYQVICNLIRENDFYEGIRAALIDKDRNPQWSPGSVSELDTAALDRYFSVGNYDLGLSERTTS